MASENKFEFESLQDTQSIKTFLEAITEGMSTGKIMFSSTEESIEMVPKGLLHFAIKARKKNNENKITMKIAWKDKQIVSAGKTLSIGK